MDRLSRSSEGLAGWMNEAEKAQRGIRQRGKAFGQAGTFGIVAILIPPTVFHEMQAVFHLPVSAGMGLKPGSRDRTGVEAGGEIAAFTRKDRAGARAHFAIHAEDDAAPGEVQTLAEIVRGIQVEPKSAGFAAKPLFSVVSWAGRREAAAAKQSFKALKTSG